ncbi:WD40-repeat-containing domain protein [Emericellopsis atlantica]|uniref:WD40-repeat-containing domain protein n=1 Tax=Emericellopsis atlantica TaxID=2614577 RepID=A0A9P8CS58_9HYPO|nr:WD40-repeat-containing domain protein [Emericellopsis atlantica]KAG9255406.1 WD40-repeat-containing domain protein [Emericellopsis atlantica]
MSSFFTAPGAQKKRKRPSAPEHPKKRATPISTSKPNGKSKGPTTTAKRGDRDESASDSDSDDDESFEGVSDKGDDVDDRSESDEEEETAAERRLRLAERYLENVKETVDEAGFDAADIDRDLIAERLKEDVAEGKGRIYRQLAAELDIGSGIRIFSRCQSKSVTAVASSAPFVYTVTKDLYLHKWRMQDLPQHQFPQSTKRKPKKPQAPPRRKPVLEQWIKGDFKKSRERGYMRHTGQILAVAASSDGKFVVTGGQDRKLIIYDAPTLKPLKVLTHHRDAITGLVFRRGTNQLYSCARDRTVKVWSLDEMAYIETLFGHQDVVVDIDALAQERCVSVGARDRTARLWKVMEETQLVFRGGATDKKSVPPGIDPRSLSNEGSMDRIAMIDDDLFVTGSDNGALCLWSVQKKKPVYIEPLAHGHDPAMLPSEVSASKNPKEEEVPPPSARWVTALKTIPYSDVFFSGSWDGYIRAWRLSDDKRSFESLGVLSNDGSNNGSLVSNGDAQQTGPIQGVINDITLFERGDRGKDGVCVVAAVAQEHRLGRWRTWNKARNGCLIFEVPRMKGITTNGVDGSSENSGDE